MTFCTVQLTNFDAYLESEYPAASDGTAKDQAADEEERRIRLAAFPFDVVLLVSYEEMDYADRWCWQQFGPADGECQQWSSEYPACKIPAERKITHSHEGRWMTHWLVKTTDNYGFCEWYFKQQADRDLFLEFVPYINWGEHYPK